MEEDITFSTGSQNLHIHVFKSLAEEWTSSHCPELGWICALLLRNHKIHLCFNFFFGGGGTGI
jgi:hypothetical protein